jgi:hypothetical protein
MYMNFRFFPLRSWRSQDILGVILDGFAKRVHRRWPTRRQKQSAKKQEKTSCSSRRLPRIAGDSRSNRGSAGWTDARRRDNHMGCPERRTPAVSGSGDGGDGVTGENADDDQQVIGRTDVGGRRSWPVGHHRPKAVPCAVAPTPRASSRWSYISTVRTWVWRGVCATSRPRPRTDLQTRSASPL